MRVARPDILVAGGDGGALEFVRALGRFAARPVADAAATLAAVAAAPPALVIADFRLPDLDGVALLARVAALSPATRRMLIADWNELPSVVRAGATPSLALRVLPRGRWSHGFQRAILDALDPSPPPPPPRDWDTLDELVETTMAAAARLPGVIIRPLPDGAAELPIVVPRDAGFEAFRCELPRRWGWPTSNLAFARRRRRLHPALAALGRLHDGQEVYLRALDERGLHVYLAVLPWRDRPLATLLFGFWAPPDVAPAVRAERARALHRYAVEHAPAFFLFVPDVDRELGDGGAAYVDEYDWIVTRHFVGPDRRARPTPLVGSHTLVGRRRRLPSRLGAGFVFVDRLSPSARRWVWLYVVFSLVDTTLTFVLVRGGVVREANPLLAGLVLHRAAAFLALKNLVSLAALFVVTRFQLSRLGRVLLPLNALGYVALDLYWAWLLLPRRLAGGGP